MPQNEPTRESTAVPTADTHHDTGVERDIRVALDAGDAAHRTVLTAVDDVACSDPVKRVVRFVASLE